MLDAIRNMKRDWSWRRFVVEILCAGTATEIWQDGYDRGLTDGFENATVVAAQADLFILPERVKEGKIVSLTGGNA